MLAFTAYLLFDCVYYTYDTEDYTIYICVAYRGHPDYYLRGHIIGSPIFLSNWSLIYIYTLLMHDGHKHSVTNID